MSALSKQFVFVINTGTSTATSVAIPSASIAPDGSEIFKSIPEKANGYYGVSDGIHTVTYTVTPNFVGNIGIQATLSTDPTESDWFTVNNTTVSYSEIVNPITTTTTNYTNFIGNFVWCRALVNRTPLPVNGSVMFINYNR
jgi:hypothetical protein